MASLNTVVAFTDKDLANQINEAHVAARNSARSAVEQARRVGELLLQASHGCPHGRWLPWLSTYCPDIAVRTAQAYMKLARDCLASPDKAKQLESLSLRQAFVALSPPKPTNVQPNTRRAAHLNRVEQKPDVPRVESPVSSSDSDEPERPDNMEALDREAAENYDRERQVALDKLLDAADPRRELTTQLEQLREKLRIVTVARDQWMTTHGEAVRQCKAEQRKVDRLHRQKADLEAELQRANERIHDLTERVAQMEGA